MSRILLVEDTPDDVELTLIAFRRHNLANEVVVRTDGHAALDYLHGGTHGLPSVVLLDLKLPGIDGVEVLRRIREHASTRLLPVVVLTSSAEERDRLKAYALGANSFIVKPVDFEQFIEAARQIGMYWLVLNAAPPEAPPGEDDASPVR